MTVPDARTEQVGHLAASTAIELSELTLIRDSLEDAFLTLTSTDRKAV